MKEEIIERLQCFKNGDLIERMELIEIMDEHLDKLIATKKNSSPFFRKMKNYMDQLSFTEPIDDFFHQLGDFYDKLYHGGMDGEERRIAVVDTMENLISLVKGRKIEKTPVRHDAKKKTETEKEFTEADEEAFDYGSIVMESSMVGTYIEEVGEFLDSAQAALIDLEHDEKNQETINQVFRCFHTVKSSSALLGYKNVEVLSHHMENMLGKVRDGEISVNSELVDIIFHGVGIIRDLVKIIETCQDDKDCLIRNFQSYRLTSYIKLIERITREYKNKKIGEILKDMGSLSDQALEKILKRQEKEENAVFGQIALEEKAVREEDLNKALQEQSRSRTKQSFVRVSSERLNSLVDMVGELVVNQSMIRQHLSHGRGESLSEQDIKQLEGVTTSIKDLVLSMGMVPLGEMFHKLRVVVRNTSRDLNKVVSFETRGEDTEMDRSLVESVYDPLVHMVRNAVSHGIENPDERAAAGKAKVGQVEISADYRGNGVEITLKDDGRGIDPEKIVDKAIALGWVEPSRRAACIKDEAFVYSLIYKPGFSTKDKADSISGRGVGMDVVMQNIDRINGKVEIQSKVGEGSVFKIKLPLTLAIIDGFVTRIMDESYVIPFEAVEEILVDTELRLIPTEGDEPMGESRGKYFPVVDFHQLLTGEKGRYEGKTLYLLINYDNTQFAIPVNAVLGKQEIVIKNLNELTRRQKLFYGGTIFGDGSIGFILDIEEIIDRFNRIGGKKPFVNDREVNNE